MILRGCSVIIALLLCASSVTAQQRRCNLNSRDGGELIAVNENTYTASLPILTCEGGLSIIANTANSMPGRVDLYGNVTVRDSARTLTADQVIFFNTRREMQSTGNAILTERATGSTIRGDILNLMEKTAQRESRIEAVGTSNVARAVIIRDAEGKPGVRDTTTLEAAQIIISGEESFRAVGNAVMRRDSLNATGHFIDYTQTARALEIAGNAKVTLPDYNLVGDSITARTNDADEIESVLSRHNTRLDSEDMNVRAAALRLAFANGEVVRMTAMQWPHVVMGQPAPPRARVESPEFHMEADSIDVVAPDQQIREAVAIGNARGERITPDSLKRFIPQGNPEVTALIANDWMRGDTVRAFFAQNPKAETDSTASEQIMERLLATGTPAQSMYRMRDEENPSLTMSINYLVASLIEVTFTDGAAALLRASGDAKGVYLQPEEAARRARVGGGTPGGVLRP
jgi:lipopolysaccharide export system protein LptA